MYAKLNRRFDGSLPERRENTQTGRGLPLAFDPQLSTVNSLTPLQSALPQNRRVTRLESADPKTRHLKSFRIRTCEKGVGEGGELLTSLVDGEDHAWQELFGVGCGTQAGMPVLPKSGLAEEGVEVG